MWCCRDLHNHRIIPVVRRIRDARNIAVAVAGRVDELRTRKEWKQWAMGLAGGWQQARRAPPSHHDKLHTSRQCHCELIREPTAVWLQIISMHCRRHAWHFNALAQARKRNCSRYTYQHACGSAACDGSLQFRIIAAGIAAAAPAVAAGSKRRPHLGVGRG